MNGHGPSVSWHAILTRLTADVVLISAFTIQLNVIADKKDPKLSEQVNSFQEESAAFDLH